LLQSRVVADRIINRFDLMKLYESRYRQEARKSLAEHTSIQQDRKTEVITITFKDRNPERAAQVAAAYVQELEKLNAEMNASGAHMERQFLEQRVKQIDQELQQSIANLSDFATKSKLLDPQNQPKSTVDEALKLETQIIAMKAELSGQEQTYQPEILKEPRARLAELERHLAQISGRSTDGTLPSIENIPKLGATFTNLERRAKLLEAVQLYLAQRLELAKTEEIKQLPAFSVLEPAEIPEQRVWPRRSLIVIASVFIGFLLSALYVIARSEWMTVDPSHPLKALLADSGFSRGSGRSA
jgi:uncharacterized protein involved in exopolysaccharide biosynthesis